MRNRKGLAVIRYDGKTVAQLYDTIILVKNHNDGTIQLNTGGYETRHTKNCMNDLLPSGFSVFQKNFTWFVSLPNGKTIHFVDNMVINMEQQTLRIA